MITIHPGSSISLPRLFWRQEVVRRVRMVVGRDRQYPVASHTVTLPPGHLLPEFQQYAPSYDRYAAGLLSELARDGSLHLIDVGGNVGDTAVLALDADPAVTVTTVEGSSFFLPYLRRNLAAFPGRVTIVDKFVGDPGTALAYVHNGSTGRFTSDAEQTQRQDFVSPESLMGVPADRTVWKTDTDGQDLALLVNHWQVISRCDVVWFEFDPAISAHGVALTQQLSVLLGQGARELLIFDNFGRLMFETRDPSALVGLAGWQAALSGSLLPSVRYFDVWAFSEPGLAHRLATLFSSPDATNGAR